MRECCGKLCSFFYYYCFCMFYVMLNVIFYTFRHDRKRVSSHPEEIHVLDQNIYTFLSFYCRVPVVLPWFSFSWLVFCYFPFHSLTLSSSFALIFISPQTNVFHFKFCSKPVTSIIFCDNPVCNHHVRSACVCVFMPFIRSTLSTKHQTLYSVTDIRFDSHAVYILLLIFCFTCTATVCDAHKSS